MKTHLQLQGYNVKIMQSEDSKCIVYMYSILLPLPGCTSHSEKNIKQTSASCETHDSVRTSFNM